MARSKSFKRTDKIRSKKEVNNARISNIDSYNRSCYKRIEQERLELKMSTKGLLLASSFLAKTIAIKSFYIMRTKTKKGGFINGREIKSY